MLDFQTAITARLLGRFGAEPLIAGGLPVLAGGLLAPAEAGRDDSHDAQDASLTR
ncbi:hypothetical protein [Streptomyces finlayi]|uniref:hypothetical protein n=1 Tax=Streptomyces finlayi TaxID=67296 RepID=UPI001625D21A|nr:hypothetical protein [Streptomyces finlayi]